MTDQKITEYERKRLENIKRNNEMLSVLKIQSRISYLSAFNKRQRSSFIFEDGQVLALREGLLFAKQNNIHLSYGYVECDKLRVIKKCSIGNLTHLPGAQQRPRKPTPPKEFPNSNKYFSPLLRCIKQPLVSLAALKDCSFSA
ncbi:WD repeat-containing protein 76-like protein [Forsythia ovata]|uniref:WD repeat-containing protein 76-like protein n=1 Tax=Forsythia ovata TaxID=205694 RepID=A0ABD1WH62_9LAMI